MTSAGQFRGLEGRDAYDILGVSPRATRQDITRARRELQRQAHPDTGVAAAGGTDHVSKLINVAATILLDEVLRREYDRWRQAPTPHIRPHAGSTPDPPSPHPTPSAWESASTGFAVPPPHPPSPRPAPRRAPGTVPGSHPGPPGKAPPGPVYGTPFAMPHPDMPMPAYAPQRPARRVPLGLILLLAMLALGGLCCLSCLFLPAMFAQ